MELRKTGQTMGICDALFSNCTLINGASRSYRSNQGNFSGGF
jgi:hypothetical protein